MKRYALIAALILLIGTTHVFADHGSDGGDNLSQQQSATVTDQEDSNDNQNEQDQEQEDAPKLEDQNQGDMPKPEDGGGFWGRLFRHDQPQNQPPFPPQGDDRKDFLGGLKQQRDDLQQQRQQEDGNQKLSRSELEAKIKAQRDAFKAQIDQVKKEKPTVRKTFVEVRFTEAISLLHSVDTRLKAKIDEFSGKGYDMTDAKKALDAAEASLKSAEDQFATLKTTTVSDTNNTSVTQPREMAKKIEDLLKQTRDSFKQVVVAMKTALGIIDDVQQPETPTTATTSTSQQ